MLNLCPAFIRLVFSFFLFFLLLLTIGQDTAYAVPCGNGVCQASQGETCSTCPADCGVCSVPTATPVPGEPTSIPAPGQPTTAPSSGDSGSSSSSTPSVTYYPSVTLNAYSPNPTNKSPLTFSGKASIEQGNIATVEYTITEGASWIQASPSDGSFNSKEEIFTFTTAQLVEGAYAMNVRAKSGAGAYTKSESYASNTVTIATTPPKISLDKFSPNPTKNQTPTVSGKASSTLAKISKVEISIDNGKSWTLTQLRGNTFTFTLKNKLEDSNYPIRARAFDNAGNVGQSEIQTLIIDTIPPIIGGGMQALGPQLLTPDSNGVVRIVAGTPATLALSMKGGVTEAKVETQDGSFDLKPQAESNLWFGNLKFDKEGGKQLKIVAVDGAGNTTERNLNTVLVEDFGKVLDKKTQKGIEEAKVSVYFFETQSKQWILWEGDSYGQHNPRITNEQGTYSFMVPAGRYYIEVTAPGYHPIQSEILNLSQTSILNYQFALSSKPKVVLNLPFFKKVILTIPTFTPPQTLFTSSLTRPSVNAVQSGLTLSPGTAAPKLTLPNLNNEDVSLSALKGNQVLLSFISPWSSLSLEQAAILSETSTTLSETQRMVVVSLQESIASTETFMKRGNYKFQVLVDKDGQTAANYKITLLPQHFFIDKDGNVREVYVGVLSKSEILKKLNNLP